MNTKIITLEDITKRHKSCTLAYGHFNTIHAGHIRYLKHAKSIGETLVVALKGDENIEGRNKYAFNEDERADALSLLSIADFILLIGTEKLKNIIQILSPKIVVLGKEFEDPLSKRYLFEDSEKKDILEVIKIKQNKNFKIEFHAGEINYASTDLLRNSQSDLFLARQKLFLDTCSKESITSKKLLSSISSWNNAHLLVIGDTIVDQYAACEPLGLSAEAPVVVVKEVQKKEFIGGAAIVASHIKALGTKCTYLSVTGDDHLSMMVEQEMQKREIGVQLIKDSSRPTTFKKRYIVENQKLFRVSRLEDHKISKSIENLVISKLHEYASVVDGIVVSDFVYGVMTQRVIDEIISLSKKHSLLVFGDLQCSSQVGDITNFKDFSLLCPNEKETRIALKDNESGLEKLSQSLIETTKTRKLVMKLGADGFIAYDNSIGDLKKIKNQFFPALSVNPVDVAGAGDSLLAVMAVGLSCKQPMMSTCAIACCMASIAVETMGNKPISKDKLISRIINVFET